jgi:hypothetical protein
MQKLAKMKEKKTKNCPNNLSKAWHNRIIKSMA